MKLLLIMNPGSRGGRARRKWRDWERGLREAGADFESVQTDARGHARELAAKAACDVVVAVGGDGTINEVLDGIAQSGRPELRMGVLYAGTSPDFCRFHGIPVDPEKAVAALLQGASQRVDVGRVVLHDRDGRERTAHFACSCNIGMGADVARTSNRCRKYLGDTLGTAAGVLRALAGCRFLDLALTVDGRAVALPATANLIVVKNPFIASGLKVDLGIQPDDGKLCALAVHGVSKAGLLALVPRFYSGTIVQATGVFMAPCESVKVAASAPGEVEFDGDAQGYLPAQIEVLPRALDLIGASRARE